MIVTLTSMCVFVLLLAALLASAQTGNYLLCKGRAQSTAGQPVSALCI